MAQHAGRLICPRCGANNFDTASSCWQCGAPLGAGASTPSPAAVFASPRSAERAPQAAPGSFMGDPAVAKRAAIALALFLPWVGLPVGWVFMMIEDHRRQTVGRICVLWSTIGLILHFLLMFVAAQAIGAALIPIAEAIIKSRGSSGSGAGAEGIPSP